MATVIKTFTFTANQEGWTGTPDTNLTVGYANQSLFAELAVGAFNETGFWNYVGDFESLGVPSTATSILSIKASVTYNYETLNRFDNGSTWQLLADTTTLIGSQNITTNTNQTTTTLEGNVVSFNAQVTDVVDFEFPINLITTGLNPPANRYGRFNIESVSFEIEYEDGTPEPVDALYVAQTSREVTELQSYSTQTEREITKLQSYVSQTNRIILDLNSYSSQTQRSVLDLNNYIGQTRRTLTAQIDAVHTSQTTRVITALQSYVGQTSREVIDGNIITNLQLAQIDNNVEVSWDYSTTNTFTIDRENYKSETSNIPAQTIQTSLENRWGLNRICQRALPLDGEYRYEFNGAGVRVYVLDTGVRVTHQEFTGRVAQGIDVASGDEQNDPTIDTSTVGHGTRVAGIILGNTVGVAQGAILVPVRIRLNHGIIPNIDDFEAAFDWIIANNPHGVRGIIQLSVPLWTDGTDADRADAKAIEAFNAGFPVISSSGNSNIESYRALNRIPEVLSIGSTTSTDARWSGSNYGATTDLYAPSDVLTTGRDSDDHYLNSQQGTSFASPHVAGVAAIILQANPNMTPQELYDFLILNSTKDVLTELPEGSHNRLLYSGLEYNPTQFTGITETTFLDQQVEEGTSRYRVQGTDPATEITNWEYITTLIAKYVSQTSRNLSDGVINALFTGQTSRDVTEEVIPTGPPTITELTVNNTAALQTTTLTTSHNHPTGSNAIVIFVGVRNTSGTISATYGGQSFTSIIREVRGVEVTIEALYILDPPTGINDLIVNIGISRAFSVFAVSLNNVEGIRASSGNNASSTSPLGNTTVSELGDLILTSAQWTRTAAEVNGVSDGETFLSHDDVNEIDSRSAITSKPGAAGTTDTYMTWNDTAWNQVIIAVSIQPLSSQQITALFTGQTRRLLNKLQSVNNQTNRSVTLLQSITSQTSRIKTALQSVVNQTSRSVNKLTDYVAQTRRTVAEAIQALFGGSTIRNLTKIQTINSQTNIIRTKLQDLILQSRRSITNLLDYIGQTTRKTSQLVEFISQTSRNINVVQFINSQTVRSITLIQSITSQSSRKINKLIEYIAQTRRTIADIVIALYNGATQRSITLIQSANSQTRRITTTLVDYLTQTSRSITLLQTITNQTRRATTFLQSIVNQTTRNITNIISIVQQTVRNINVLQSINTQTRRSITNLLTLIQQTRRVIIKLQTTTSQTSRIVKKLTIYITQTRRTIAAAIQALYEAATLRFINKIQSINNQTRRNITLLQTISIQSRRIITKISEYISQTRRSTTQLISSIVQTNRVITILQSYASQTNRNIIAVIDYIGQTTRKINKLEVFISQTRRNIVLGVQAIYNGATSRSISKLTASIYQTSRNIIGSTLIYIGNKAVQAIYIGNKLINSIFKG